MGTIKYKNISKGEFDEFLRVLKELDINSYNEEGADGFVDLYNYWNNIVTNERSGRRRFNEKIKQNRMKLKNKSK